VYERVTKPAAKWKKWWQKRSISKGQGVPYFDRNDSVTHKSLHPLATEPERLKAQEKHGDYKKFYCFGLSLRYKKGFNFA